MAGMTLKECGIKQNYLHDRYRRLCFMSSLENINWMSEIQMSAYNKKYECQLSETEKAHIRTKTGNVTEDNNLDFYNSVNRWLITKNRKECVKTVYKRILGKFFYKDLSEKIFGFAYDTLKEFKI